MVCKKIKDKLSRLAIPIADMSKLPNLNNKHYYYSTSTTITTTPAATATMTTLEFTILPAMLFTIYINGDIRLTSLLHYVQVIPIL